MSTSPIIRRRERPSAVPTNSNDALLSPSIEEGLAETKPTYEVGYGRPPVATRFGGPRGNRSGRKKGSKSRRTIIRDELDVKVDVPGFGKMPKFQVAVRQLVNQAAKGDLRAMMALMKVALEHEREEVAQVQQAAEAPLTEHDQSVVELLMTMAGEAAAAKAKSETPNAGGKNG